MDPKVAIIIPCRNETLYLKHTIDFMLKTEARDRARIIVINDGSRDRCCDFLQKRKEYQDISLITTEGIGAAQARNLGVENAGDVEVYLFCDGHILVQKGWMEKLLSAFERVEVDVICPGIGPFDPKQRTGYGQSWNNELDIQWLGKPEGLREIPLAPGACMAIRKEVFDTVGGFDRGFNSWGYEDVELSVKLWLFGYKIFVNPEVRIGHHFRKVPPYQVDAVEFFYNRLRMAVSHFNEERISKVVKIINKSPDYHRTVAKIILSDSIEQRKSYLEKRIHDDEWFFSKFKIPF